MESSTVRIHLAGNMSVELAGRRIDASRFPGRQGRVAFAYLVVERGRPVTRAELAEAIWTRELPAAWESALSAIASKLRSLLARADRSGRIALTGAPGCYELRLPPNTWVDLEVAAEAIHEAEAALRVGSPAAAYGPSAVAHHIARRPLLPGEEGTWIELRRDRLREILLRALEARCEIYLWNDEQPLALQCARELVALEPFRESGHRLVMRAHAAMGNGAEALRAYEHCRRLIAQELGVDPSSATKEEHLRILQTLA